MDDSGYPVGQTMRASATFKVNGAVQDPTTVVMDVYAPGGAVTHPTPVRLSTGVYYHDLLLSAPGLWAYRFTGDAPAAGVVEGSAYVRDAVPIAYTYAPDSPIGRVRLYLDDRDFSDVSPSTPRSDRSAIFEDAEIQVFIDDEGGDPLRGAAAAAEAIAANKNLLLTSRKTGDQSANFGDARSHYLKLAETLRKRADRADGVSVPAFGTVPVVWTDDNYRQNLDDAIAREELPPGAGW